MTPDEDAQNRLAWFLVGVGMLLPMLVFVMAYVASGR